MRRVSAALERIKSMPSEIYSDTEKLWKEFYADAHREAPARSEFRDLYNELEVENRQIAAKGLQPSLGS